jgi:hypothetical protein
MLSAAIFACGRTHSTSIGPADSIGTADGSAAASACDAASDSCIARPEAGVPSDQASSCSVVERAAPVRGTHRESAPTCSRDRPRGPVCVGNPPGYVKCSRHEDCRAGANGRCSVYGYACSYDQCFTDVDCGDGKLCDCNGGDYGSHLCLPSDCRTDADCVTGYRCTPTLSIQCSNLGGPVGFYCQSDRDDCTSDADCASRVLSTGGRWCVYDRNASRWVCGGSNCETP